MDKVEEKRDGAVHAGKLHMIYECEVQLGST
jgi:hypothetical protein